MVPAVAAADVDGRYELSLSPGGEATDDLDVEVPDEFDDPDLDGRSGWPVPAAPGAARSPSSWWTTAERRAQPWTGAARRRRWRRDAGAGDGFQRRRPAESAGDHGYGLRLRTDGTTRTSWSVLHVEGAAHDRQQHHHDQHHDHDHDHRPGLGG